MNDKLTLPLAVGDAVRLKGQGAIGRVVRVSPRLRAAYLVSFPVGPARAFRPDELERVTGSMVPPVGPVALP